MTTQTEAQRLANTYEADPKRKQDWDRKVRAALRRLDAAAMECGSGAGCCYQSAKIEALEAQVERMRTEGIRLHEVELTLKAANADLLESLKKNAQVLAWLAFGECRGFTADLPTALEATSTARAAIAKHGGAE